MQTTKQLLPKRKNIRLPHYNYSTNGCYFVTVSAETRGRIFGAIGNNGIELNDAGKMIDLWWQKMFEKFKGISIDEYIVMPDHLHGIINIVLSTTPMAEKNMLAGENMEYSGDYMESPLRNSNRYCGLGQYISWFKRMTTNECIKHVKHDNWKPFNKRLWQRSYYDHVIRNEVSLNKIREYIKNNPFAGDIPCIVPVSNGKNNIIT